MPIQSAAVSSSSWPPDLDALSAAPTHHHLLLENEHVRVLHTEIPAGDRTAVHTHRWPAAMYVLSWSDFVRRDADGNVLLDSRSAGLMPAPGDSLWGQPLPPHTLENIGDRSLRIISVELKTPDQPVE